VQSARQIAFAAVDRNLGKALVSVPLRENVVNNPWVRKALLVSVLAGAALVVGCGSANPDGKYRDSDGAVNLELKDGKASLDYGQIHIDGTYKVDGDKITIQPVVGDTRQTMVFVINKDGSIDGPPGSDIAKLQKVK
jgi:hypothetical protein